jgi:spore germination protein KA
MYGDTLILIDGAKFALVANTKGWSVRSISEPEDERILEGPREGFSESAMLNLSLVRRKLQTPDLSIELLRVGRRTDTYVYIAYLGSLAPHTAVKELKRRIESIKIDGIFDSNYIAELILSRRPSLFRSSGSTERPDIVAARLLEGRIAVIVDGSPMVLTLPYLFAENFQSDEDYYQNFLTASVGRLLRYVCFFLSISLPAIYVALTVYHRRLLPTAFLLSLTEARASVPFSSVAECVGLILVFEILKEAGVRTQQSLGTALSIVGGLVVGQAAVEAKIVSAPMLIVVALSGIAGLMVPRLRAAVFYLRFLLVLGSSLLGLYGYLIGAGFILVSILSLESFGFEGTPALSSLYAQRYKDTVIRAPFSRMRTRPPISANEIRYRESEENYENENK